MGHSIRPKTGGACLALGGLSLVAFVAIAGCRRPVGEHHSGSQEAAVVERRVQDTGSPEEFRRAFRAALQARDADRMAELCVLPLRRWDGEHVSNADALRKDWDDLFPKDGKLVMPEERPGDGKVLVSEMPAEAWEMLAPGECVVAGAEWRVFWTSDQTSEGQASIEYFFARTPDGIRLVGLAFTG